MKTLMLGVVLASQLCCGRAHAFNVPGWHDDPRVRQVIYRADGVVRVQAQRGFATHIALDPHEYIEVVAPGDRDGWQVAPDAIGRKLRSLRQRL